jgi:hypothetical protein
VPQLPPRRPPGFYEEILLAWRLLGINHGLTDTEMVTLGSQFTGLAVAATELTPAGQERLLGHASNIMHTAYTGRIAVRNGFGHRAVES